MNVKNKIISFIMCFIIFISTCSNSFANDKKPIEPLVFDGGVISAPMLATVSSLAVATGIVIKESDDIYDIGKMFYDYVERNNELTWDFVQSSFVAGHTLINDVVHVNNNFLDIVKGFFDNTFDVADVDVDLNETTLGNIVFNKRIYINGNYLLNGGKYSIPFTPVKGDVGVVEIYYVPSNKNVAVMFRVDGVTKLSLLNNKLSLDKRTCVVIDQPKNLYTSVESYSLNDSGTQIGRGANSNTTPLIANGISFPYTGGYDWGNVESKKENDSISLPIPGNLGQLVGQGSTDFWENTDGLVGGGSISLPGVENPSIDVTDDVFAGNPSTDIPGVDNPSIPNEGIWSTIKDFIISLVVPADSFWTDTFNGFRNNLNNNFPMLDMSKFDSLLVGGKPFPNIYAYGSKIVDGDIINSIVDWLRPIVAGFIMICLMFFNYRKVYKIIRNSEPFGNIAPGTSDFSTGLSTADIKQIVADAKRETERRTYRK